MAATTSAQRQTFSFSSKKISRREPQHWPRKRPRKTILAIVFHLLVARKQGSSDGRCSDSVARSGKVTLAGAFQPDEKLSFGNENVSRIFLRLCGKAESYPDDTAG